MKKKCFFVLLLLAVVIAKIRGGTTDVVFLNTDKMYVGVSEHSSKVALYVTQAYRDLGNSNAYITLYGYMQVGGNFYHDALSNSFSLDGSGYNDSKSTGTFIFSNNSGQLRYITTQTADYLTCAAFDRGNYYAAFPNIVLESNDSLIIPARMGIDATSFHLGTTNTGGNMVLRSDKVNGYDYDASMRVTGSGTSAALVDLGSVVVEREMSLYRYGDGSNPSIFPFATPFKDTQLSGYFAGNWVRRPLSDGTLGSVNFVYGNKDNAPADGIIDKDQYVYLAAEKLVPSQAYLIKPRPKGFDYSVLKSTGGLWYTADAPALYDKEKFYFNGKVYTVTPYKEQLFADDNLITLSASGTPSSTVNWLVGNSYTCPISTVDLAKAMENASGLNFSPIVYVYTAGSQSYQPMNITGSGSTIAVSNYTEIPAMSVFMLRLSKNTSQSGNIALGKGLLKHGKYSHGTPNMVKAQRGTASAGVTDQINFKVYPTENSHVYDLAAIGLRDDASEGSDSYDLSKANNPDVNSFQLYTLSNTGSKLSGNGVPLNTESVPMEFRSNKNIESYTIEVSNISTLTSEGAWLMDNTTGDITDLKQQSQYKFTSNSNNEINRFTVYFKNPGSATDVDIDNLPSIEGQFKDNLLILDKLSNYDLNSKVSIYDVQGHTLSLSTITSYPQIQIKTAYPQGVYLIHLEGKRNTTIKVIKK